jgi:putative membrane protein
VNLFTSSILTNWHPHPEVLISLTFIELFYLFLVYYIPKNNKDITHNSYDTTIFTSGILILLIALISPIHEISDGFLFSAHMVQHLLLTLIAPPLLVMSTPDWMISPIFKITPIKNFLKLITKPIIALSIFTLMFSIWHLPNLYHTSVTNHYIHISEHLMFMSTAIIMWIPIFSRINELPKLSYLLQLPYIFILSIGQILVFAPITFSSEPIYQWYINAPRIWNITPLTDQQLGGIIMKVGSGAIFLSLMIIAFFNWYKEENQV